MKYRALGNTGIQVSLVSYGTGGPSQFGQKTGLDDAGRKRLVCRALELGINLFDTSEMYGESEAQLGMALESVPRDTYLLATKWSHRNRATGGLRDASEVIPGVEASLRKMRTDYVDVLQFHGINGAQYDGVIESLYPEFEKLKRDGKVRAIGFTEMMTEEPRHDTPETALTRHPDLWDAVMLKYGIMNQWAAKNVFPLAERHSVGILNMAPVRLTLTRPEKMKAQLEKWLADGTVPAGGLDESDPFGWLVRNGVSSIIDAGYRFAASHPAVTTVITGTSSIEHLEANVASITGEPLPEATANKLVELFGNTAAPD